MLYPVYRLQYGGVTIKLANGVVAGVAFGYVCAGRR
jgi:hypothetical protein